LLSSTSTGKDWRKYMLEKHWQFNQRHHKIDH
jgi:hypothetical protein